MSFLHAPQAPLSTCASPASYNSLVKLLQTSSRDPPVPCLLASLSHTPRRPVHGPTSSTIGSAARAQGSPEDGVPPDGRRTDSGTVLHASPAPPSRLRGSATVQVRTACTSVSYVSDGQPLRYHHPSEALLDGPLCSIDTGTLERRGRNSSAGGVAHNSATAVPALPCDPKALRSFPDGAGRSARPVDPSVEVRRRCLHAQLRQNAGQYPRNRHAHSLRLLYVRQTGMRMILVWTLCRWPGIYGLAPLMLVYGRIDSACMRRRL
ncbi:hypothetical protein C8Q80DRAFT_619878 [Daedaleopsis nitida]|nr:hypothetical protein C8Q80DRAFT_619878 [Daedaleopsis nitida]